MTIFTVNPKIASEEVPVGTYEAVGIRSMVQLFRMKNEDLGKPELHAKSKVMRFLGTIAEVGDREMKLFELSTCLIVFKKYTPNGGVRTDTLRRYMLYINPVSETGKKFLALAWSELVAQAPGTEWDEDRPNTEHWLDYTEDQRLKAKAQKTKKAKEENAGITGGGVLTLNIEEGGGTGEKEETTMMIEGKKKERTEVLSAVEALDDDE